MLAAAVVSIGALATGPVADPARGGTTPVPPGTYVGQSASGRWVILTVSSEFLNVSASVADCQVATGLSITGTAPMSTPFSMTGGDNPEYWISGSFDGVVFATGVVGMRRFDAEGNTVCEHEETWHAELTTPAPTTQPTSTTTSTTTTTTTPAITTTTSPATTSPATVTSAPPAVPTSASPTSGPTTSSPPNSAPAVVPTTSPPGPTDPPVAPTAPPSAAPELVATIADSTVVFGQATTVAASGFAVGERVTATLHSTPRLLGTFIADELGVVHVTVAVTEDDGAGRHEVVFVGERSGTVTVGLSAIASVLPATR